MRKVMKKGDIGNEADASSDMEIIEGEGANNLDIMLDLIEQQEKTQQRKKGVKELMHKFVADIDSHIEQLDTQYLDGLHKFFTTYLDTVERTEPMTSTTPHLSTLLHTYFKKPSSMTSNAGCRQIHVQPTALSRRREGIPKGSQRAPAGRPQKRLLEQSDCHIQTKRGKQDHVKRKQNLILNERKNQPNHFKHGSGH